MNWKNSKVLHEWLIFDGSHVGKYTVRPMDGVGLERLWRISDFTFSHAAMLPSDAQSRTATHPSLGEESQI